MVRKRSYPRGNNDLPVFTSGFNELSKKQEEGEAVYGDAVLTKEQRLGQSHVFFAGLTSLPPRSSQVTYISPARVVPSAAEISDVLNEMTHDIVIPEEEMRLVEEARRLGWSWQKIANELQGRTPKQLMRAYSELRPNRYIYDPLRSTRPRLIPPPPLDSSTRFQPPLKRPHPFPPPSSMP
eukprot:g2037.t1